MNIQALILRFIFGGTIIVLITLFSETKYKTLSGLIVLFPAITVIGYYFASKSMTTVELQNMTIFSILSLPTLGAFFIGFYISIEYYSTIISIVIGLSLWFLSAIILISIDKYYLQLI